MLYKSVFIKSLCACSINVLVFIFGTVSVPCCISRQLYLVTHTVDEALLFFCLCSVLELKYLFAICCVALQKRPQINF